jgi:hypothetical protein
MIGGGQPTIVPFPQQLTFSRLKIALWSTIRPCRQSKLRNNIVKSKAVLFKRLKKRGVNSLK